MPSGSTHADLRVDAGAIDVAGAAGAASAGRAGRCIQWLPVAVGSCVLAVQTTV